MPTYVYRRTDGTTFETFQKISDAPLTEDPETGQPVQRVISGGAGLQFKGDGFYLTDYVRKGNGKGASDSTAGESVGESSGGSSGTSSAPSPSPAAAGPPSSAKADD